MQSMMHTMMTNRYYKFMPYYTNVSTQWLIYSLDATQPIRKRGYIAVMTAIGAHLLLVAYVLIVFGICKGTKRTMLSINQAWLVFAQVALIQREMSVGGESDQDKIGSTTATDHEVEKSLKHRGLKDKIFVLDDDDQTGVVRFRAI
jgi:hypothetical protein